MAKSSLSIGRVKPTMYNISGREVEGQKDEDVELLRSGRNSSFRIPPSSNADTKTSQFTNTTASEMRFFSSAVCTATV